MSERKYHLGQEVFDILTTGEETDGRHDVMEVTLPGGYGTPLHLHTRYEERVYTLEGRLLVWAGEDHKVLAPGDFYTIRTEVPHRLEVGSEGAKALVISSPAGFAELISRAATPAAEAVPDTEPDFELFGKVSAELGDVILGPPGTNPSDLPSDAA